MLFSYNWLQSFFDKKLPRPKKLAELLTLHSFEVKEVERKNNDFVFDIDVTPNRVDCFSHLGIARECSAFTNLKFLPVQQAGKMQNFCLPAGRAKFKEDKDIKIKDFIEIEVENRDDCPRYVGRVIFGVKVGPSPKWMQKKLISCGVLPINNIVDATNYVMLEVGQPLHAFDLDRISGRKIIVRRAKRREKIKALDGRVYNLDEDVLIIADSEKPLAIAGIKGGEEAEISPETKNIFIESANFNPILIRKSARKLKLKTDASFRFEHGLDPNLVEIGLERVVSLIQEVAQGKVAKGGVDFYPKRVKPWTIKFNIKRVREVLGIDIPPAKIIEILEKLDLKIKKKTNENLWIVVPTYRKDLLIEEDLVEEVGRIYGYKNLLKITPKAPLQLPEKDEIFVWGLEIKKILKEMGFVEVYNYSFVGREDKEKLNLGKLIELGNPISDEFRYLRPTFLINLIKNVEKNQKNFNQFKLFEIGKVFYQKKGKFQEKRMLSGVIFGEREGFPLLKGFIDILFEQIGISDKYYDEYQPTPDKFFSIFWHIKKSAEIKVSGKEIGFLGEVSKRVTELYGVKGNILAFDIDFDELVKLAREEAEYLPISKYPSAIRDIAILVPLRTKVADVLNVIYASGGSLLRDVDLFDIYVGEEIPDGLKNLAFHLIFQSEKKALSGKEIDELFERIIKAIEENPDWEVRK